jgi:hypothetical protein
LRYLSGSPGSPESQQDCSTILDTVVTIEKHVNYLADQLTYPIQNLSYFT